MRDLLPTAVASFLIGAVTMLFVLNGRGMGVPCTAVTHGTYHLTFVCGTGTKPTETGCVATVPDQRQ